MSDKKGASRRLEGKRCLITGGSRGLGLAMGKEFARCGAKVAFTYSRNDEDAEEAAEEIAACGERPLVFRGSVADSVHVKSTMASLRKQWDGVDVLVNNAGISQVLPVALLDEEDWDAVMNVHVKGAYLFSRMVLKPMIRARSGQILMIGNFSSERVVEAPIHYAAAKSALRGLTEALAKEVGRYNIQVNMLSPGLMDVGLARMLPPHRIEEYTSQCALGRLATVAEMAKTAAFMVSDDNRFMTGAKLVADGGL